jgi:hypothetical protein
MVIEGNSDIIKHCEFKAELKCQWLVFRNDMVLVVSEDFMALYKNEASIGDPLGNGLKSMVELPKTIGGQGEGFVKSYAAGFVGLVDGKAILITPNDIQLFSNSQDALHNQNEIARLKLA